MFFFFKQKTAYEMRISDWSSDVCSSDLAFVRRKRLPIGDGRLPFRALGGHGAAFQIGEGLFVGREQAGSRARLDRHVGDGQSTLDRHVAEDGTAIFHNIAGAARRADAAADRPRRSEEHTSELQSLMTSSY